MNFALNKMKTSAFVSDTNSKRADDYLYQQGLSVCHSTALLGVCLKFCLKTNTSLPVYTVCRLHTLLILDYVPGHETVTTCVFLVASRWRSTIQENCYAHGFRMIF